MNCLKCGRETENDQVFCQSCLDDMAQYPIKPGTAVQLPHRAGESASKKSGRRKRTPTAEELLVRQKATSRHLLAACLVLTAALVICGFFLGKSLIAQRNARQLGKNYTIVTTTAPSQVP